jgi:hypothetical protein
MCVCRTSTTRRTLTKVCDLRLSLSKNIQTNTKHCPTVHRSSATTGIKLQAVPDLNEGHFDWFMGEFEQFTKRQELERAILKAADMLEKGDFEPVEKLIKDAVQISLTRDMGTDYFADPAARINKYFNSGGQVSTGWPQLDRLLYGGFSRGELNIFAGGSGSGKSLGHDEHCIELVATRTQWRVHHIGTE